MILLVLHTDLLIERLCQAKSKLTDPNPKLVDGIRCAQTIQTVGLTLTIFFPVMVKHSEYDLC